MLIFSNLAFAMEEDWVLLAQPQPEQPIVITVPTSPSISEDEDEEDYSEELVSEFRIGISRLNEEFDSFEDRNPLIADIISIESKLLGSVIYLALYGFIEKIATDCDRDYDSSVIECLDYIKYRSMYNLFEYEDCEKKHIKICLELFYNKSYISDKEIEGYISRCQCVGNELLMQIHKYKNRFSQVEENEQYLSFLDRIWAYVERCVAFKIRPYPFAVKINVFIRFLFSVIKYADSQAETGYTFTSFKDLINLRIASAFLIVTTGNGGNNLLHKIFTSNLPEEKVNRLLSDLLSVCHIFSTSLSLPFFLDLQNNDGDTPLHLAAKNGYTIASNILIEYGADSKLENNDGKTYAQCLYDYMLGHYGSDLSPRQSIDVPDIPEEVRTGRKRMRDSKIKNPKRRLIYSKPY